MANTITCYLLVAVLALGCVTLPTLAASDCANVIALNVSQTQDIECDASLERTPTGATSYTYQCQNGTRHLDLIALPRLCPAQCTPLDRIDPLCSPVLTRFERPHDHASIASGTPRLVCLNGSDTNCSCLSLVPASIAMQLDLLGGNATAIEDDRQAFSELLLETIYNVTMNSGPSFEMRDNVTATVTDVNAVAYDRRRDAFDGATVALQFSALAIPGGSVFDFVTLRSVLGSLDTNPSPLLDALENGLFGNIAALRLRSTASLSTAAPTTPPPTPAASGSDDDTIDFMLFVIVAAVLGALVVVFGVLLLCCCCGRCGRCRREGQQKTRVAAAPVPAAPNSERHVMTNPLFKGEAQSVAIDGLFDSSTDHMGTQSKSTFLTLNNFSAAAVDTDETRQLQLSGTDGNDQTADDVDVTFDLDAVADSALQSQDTAFATTTAPAGMPEYDSAVQDVDADNYGTVTDLAPQGTGSVATLRDRFNSTSGHTNEAMSPGSAIPQTGGVVVEEEYVTMEDANRPSGSTDFGFGMPTDFDNHASQDVVVEEEYVTMDDANRPTEPGLPPPPAVTSREPAAAPVPSREIVEDLLEDEYVTMEDAHRPPAPMQSAPHTPVSPASNPNSAAGSGSGVVPVRSSDEDGYAPLPPPKAVSVSVSAVSTPPSTPSALSRSQSVASTPSNFARESSRMSKRDSRSREIARQAREAAMKAAAVKAANEAKRLRHPREWSFNECVKWLKFHGFADFVDTFYNNGFEGSHLVLLQAQSFAGMRTHTPERVRELIDKIAELKAAGAWTPPSEEEGDLTLAPLEEEAPPIELPPVLPLTTDLNPTVEASVSNMDPEALDMARVQYFLTQELGRERSELMLNHGKVADGMFLIRESKTRAGTYVLTMAHAGTIHHFPIERTPTNRLKTNNGHQFADWEELVHFFKTKDREGLPCRLTQACSSYDHMLTMPATTTQAPNDEQFGFGDETYAAI
ncbi:uncharacterized protein MONBRDRAFT_37412 [Monosiga brevicollis MX1]|uniref:SH2 domain-containing protein n=1 Tax=Monosiga brevicollis TaxID=81824 RepID=A9V1L3_MONBE|nr:uncharacterized protein MONBRDRAFT_37412 [Monosiga brevicollis MX1]EDQ88459.1 predicted protein [Monosiga brevicollis MX1]|eukprot:XP_001746563.1 hypothetical protein [Monosiga brevicollis MX1]